MLRRILRERLARRLHLPEVPVALRRVAGLGFSPGTIIDGGAHRGEFVRLCRSIWRHSRIVAIEPQDVPCAELRELARVDGAITVHQCLLGATAAESIALHSTGTAASVLEERARPHAMSGSYPMRRIDDLCSEADFVKLDLQGYELEALKGAERTLESAQLLLIEVNFLDIHRDVPLLADIVPWLDRRDWVAYDVCGLARRPLDGALWQADLLFTPRASGLRADKRWK